MTTIESRMEEAYKVFTKFSAESTQSTNECSLYGELLAKKLRGLDENDRAVAMLEIDHLMFRFKQRKYLMQKTLSMEPSPNTFFAQYQTPQIQLSGASSVTSHPSSYSYPFSPSAQQY